ncbi:VirB4 family type IV secretion/conjugal transfer ATPase [Piscinibacter sp. HJYY11]|uniref:VirB4 family type IV secretion/conjugal transfer ATPase n=1 Tax=Piscinibacter sp. HJYY11 TaxID=2801333 RepID=UPI00191E9404|nr:VirB4 family type IV secretion/conjugal transfer ATPase [Piscinibacter sp. HJYY11]MBL0726125.1 VirB4 family type IV secretion/conjugal transfer ATPase [Piscinibacter sp. HJYY11]
MLRPHVASRPGAQPVQPRHWARAAAENPLARFIPFSSLLTQHDVITRGGDFMRTWRLAGVPFECADEQVISERHEAFSSLLRNLAGGQWAIWTHRLHRAVRDALADPEEAGFARDLSQAYQHQLGQRPMMSNELYLTLVYRPNASRMARTLQSQARSKDLIAAAHADALRIMEERSALVDRVLRGFGPELLGTRWDGARAYSEVAEFLGYLVNGIWRPVPQQAGALYRTLPVTRLSFGGDKLELRSHRTPRYAALADIKEYADAVEPGILNALLYEGSEFIETQSFSILPRREAMRALELQRDQLIASDDVVETQVAAMDVALNELGDGQFCMGEYHYSLVVFGDDVTDAGRRAAQAIGAVGEASSLQMAPVDLVADAAWFAQWPGNWQWRPRDAKLSSRAFAALASGHNFARGKRDGNPWGEALALLRTPSGQPFYLNLHTSPAKEDSSDKKLPGNTLIIGSTGVGKTTLEMFLLTLTRKWRPAPRLVLFDLDRGCEIAIRALGGKYFTLEAGQPTGCNPLQRDPTPARIQFWEQLLRTCLSTPALPLLPSDERAIADAVRAVAMMPANLRRFSTVRQNLPKTGENSLYERLGRWCEGGALGWVFDQADDRLMDLHQAPVIGFDTTEFLDLPEVRTPVMLYLLQVMDELVNGERLIYVISEFWKALDHEIFSDFAKQKQKTIRKQNGLGIFDTQSPSDVLRHPIGRTMIEQSVTKIFLANAEAVRHEYVEGFGLSEAEFDIVRSLGAQGGRRFLVKQGHASAICELDLSGLEHFITVLSATTDNIALLDQIRERHGDDPFNWLPVLLQAVQDRKARNARKDA